MLVVIDPGHGGSDPGAVYNGRQEKDDVLRLGKAVGALLEARGVDVVYTRDGDFYETPFKKAQDGNNVGADYFVSIHRNSSEYPDQYSGAEVLVYSDSGIKKELANNILEGMEKAGLKNLGVDERKDLVVLRRTRMPAVLVEAGFINSDKDNETFDRNFDELAQGIANGILHRQLRQRICGRMMEIWGTLEIWVTWGIWEKREMRVTQVAQKMLEMRVI